MAPDKPLWHRIWGEAAALLNLTRRLGWVDLLVVVSLFGLFYGLIALAGEWTGEHRASVEIDTSPLALPRYTLFSLSRGLIAYLLSLGFTLVYGYWAAKDRVAERVLIPVLDILQSIPILSFLPGLVLALEAAFPSSNIGLELASILTIFTGQAWNMTFSFYHSLRSIPLDQREVATVYRFTWWQRFKGVELPFSTVGLVWNSMMSMAGGWFFLTISEAFSLRGRDFRLPGLGSYMKVAVDEGRIDSMLWAILAMIVMIVALDQLLWRPVVVWAQKFRVEEGGYQEAMSSWFLDWLRRSRILTGIGRRLRRWQRRHEDRQAQVAYRKESSGLPSRWAPWVSLLAFGLLLATLAYGGFQLLLLLRDVAWSEWIDSLAAAGVTLGRVLLTLVIGTAWALPAGLAIGLSPRLSHLLQPVVQVVASFPASMLYPLVIAGLAFSGVSLGWGSILLMLLGTQWYILFNVIAGAMAMPADLREAARSYRIQGRQRFWVLYLPAVFPQLLTGWVTAAGGAWNASIVAEYVSLKDKEVLQTWGLGADISRAYDQANFPLLAASVLVLSAVVVGFNRTVWRSLYRIAEERFSLSK
jgi:NitT/TauT family transport system permease protein